MIRGDHDIQHALAHMEIGALIVDTTIVQKRFGASAVEKFFSELRNGHRSALAEHDAALGEIIGYEEEEELKTYGAFGTFAGRLAMRESGLIAVESALHHVSSNELSTAFRSSLRNAVTILKNG